MHESSALWWSSMCRSPRQRRRRLHPACLDMACSMWSRKPIPVSTSMVWEREACAAWDLESTSVSGLDCSRDPPSRFRTSWIFVSFVSRLRVAVRRRDSAIMCVPFLSEGLQLSQYESAEAMLRRIETELKARSMRCRARPMEIGAASEITNFWSESTKPIVGDFC